MSDDFAWLDATAHAELVRSGAVQPSELVEAAIARIERVNPKLNAVIHPLFEKARATASGLAASRAGARGAPASAPFAGVPFLVKDAVCHTAGDPYHLGMRALKDAGHVASADSELARRFRAAGFVFVGKTNTPELAMSATTEPLAYGATRNPWQLEHSPGGSSGGSAAAVAAGLAPAAHANDMGGSIRIPASCCGLVGLKPTRARGTLAPAFGEYWGPLTHEHVVTRSVRDAAGILDAVAGPAPGDPYTAPPPLRPFAQEVGAPAGALRIGFSDRSALAEVEPECAQAVRNAARLLEDLGHHVEASSPAALDESPPMLGWISVGIARDLERVGAWIGRELEADDVEPMNWMMAEAGRAMSGTAYVASADDAFAWARRVAGWWEEGHDLLVTPTLPAPPVRLGTLAPNVALPELMAGLGGLTVFTWAFNLTGQPAVSLPLHWTADGLPVGVQLVAPQGREDLLLRVAAQLETAAPWAGRRPAID